MREEPVVDFWVTVRRCPGVVLSVSVNSEANLATGLCDSVGHFFAFCDGDNRIFRAVESPDRNAMQIGGHGGWIAAPANGKDRGETFRVGGSKSPGAIAAHTEAGGVDTRFVNAKLAGHVVYELN